MTVLITLTLAGADTGPFDLYSDLDGYVSAFETGVSKASLLLGYPCASVPDYTNTIRVKSNNGLCTNDIDLPVEVMVTTTTSSTLYPLIDYDVTSTMMGGCVISISNITGGSGGYSVGATTFPDVVSAENNSTWVAVSAIDYGSTVGPDIFYTVVKDSDGNIMVKGGLPYCQVTTTTSSTLAP